MAIINGDTTSSIFQVRLYIGDTESILLSDEIIQQALTDNSDDVKAASIQSLKWAISYLSQQTYQEVGDVIVDYNKLYDQAVKQLNRLSRDSSFNPTLGMIFGGTSKAEKLRVTSDTDFVGSPFNTGDSLK